jgi:preprotein translocase subunit SecF
MSVGDIVQSVNLVHSVGNDTVRAPSVCLNPAQLGQVQDALVKRFDLPRKAVSTQFIGPSWGKDISRAALRALIFFIAGVVIFLSLYFEWKMALAAMLALLHDLVITAGLYSLVGFEVTPATVIGFLTILGYSLYDTVVVFDKVRENTAGLAGGSRMTFSQATNLAVNQTLVRSINTTIIALLPIGAILFAGTVLLGAGPLKDLALALFIGVAVGAYSSIYIAPPLLTQFKEREPAMQALAKRVAGRRAGTAAETPSSKRRAAADQSDVTEPELAEDTAVPAGAGAASAARPPTQDRRPAAASQRNQPRKGGGGRNRSKKRR